MHFKNILFFDHFPGRKIGNKLIYCGNSLHSIYSLTEQNVIILETFHSTPSTRNYVIMPKQILI
ncbi:hypothetical protein BpHYR1_035150 [Brachionus plicatilis]|uniref:Uncharacterized protein n=1 Tax=Brachionus plicatilis TaxID=10195 RepID=A0A3M7SDV9_BRAPC|nr:hypothetical protein BpHYR1_035150 [Brachionus plicatilis]